MTDTTTTRRLKLAEKAILGFIAGVAGSIAVLEVIFLAVRVTGIVGDPTTTLTNAFLNEPLEAAFASPAVVSATADAVTLVVEGAPPGTRAALVGAAILTSLLTIGICAVVAWLCLRVFVGRPFVRSATWGIAVVAILVLLAGLGAPTLSGIANAEAAVALGLDELAPFLVTLDLAPLGWCFALAVVAGAFEIGQRLQRDSEGLV